MAQLRDGRTGELLAEGAPVEMVALADALGRGEVMFDDVGAAFDPDAVRQAHEQHAAGLDDAATGEKDRDAKDRLREAAKATRAALHPPKAQVDRAKRRQAEARNRVGG